MIGDLLALADVGPAFDRARAAVDAAFGHRTLRRGAPAVAAEVALRSAVASAALTGSAFPVDEVRGGTVTDPIVQGALRVNGDLVRLGPQWMVAPPQVLTRLHILAARDVVASPGRPVGGAARLFGLSAVLASETPALLRAAVVHGEVLAAAAFEGPNDVVARGAARLTLIAAGLDPSGLLPVDAGHAAREPEYVGAAGAYATGTRDGVRSWLKHYAAAVEEAASVLVSLCTAPRT